MAQAVAAPPLRLSATIQETSAELGICAVRNPHRGYCKRHSVPVAAVISWLKGTIMSADLLAPLARLLSTSETIEGLRDLFAAEEPLDDIAVRVAETAVAAVPHADAVSISVLSWPDARTAAAAERLGVRASLSVPLVVVGLNDEQVLVGSPPQHAGKSAETLAERRDHRGVRCRVAFPRTWRYRLVCTASPPRQAIGPGSAHRPAPRTDLAATPATQFATDLGRLVLPLDRSQLSPCVPAVGARPVRSRRRRTAAHPRGVAELVVDLLEVVDVDEDEDEAGPPASHLDRWATAGWGTSRGS